MILACSNEGRVNTRRRHTRSNGKSVLQYLRRLPTNKRMEQRVGTTTTDHKLGTVAGTGDAVDNDLDNRRSPQVVSSMFHLPLKRGSLPV